MKAIRLRTEYLKEPLGIGIFRPCLFWNCEGGRTQTAYQITAENDEGTCLWDGGIVRSGSMHATWGGDPIPACTRVIWKVRLWDENGAAGCWTSSWFETGMPENESWPVRWISGGYTPKKKLRYPVDSFKKEFEAGEVKKARLYITACGLYEARLNGIRVGNFVLAPGHTDYRKRIQYQTYDVTGLLKTGLNTLTVSVADGWYRGSCGAWGLKNEYGTQTKLLALLKITDTHGNITVIGTDKSWLWSNDGPIRFADNKDGESVDARLVPTYGMSAREIDCPIIPTASNNVPVTEHETFTPRVITTPSGKKVLDIGQNIAGYISFSVNAQAGQRIVLRFGEMFDEEGEFTQKNIQCSNKKITTPLQKVEYICRDGQNEYKTAFAIFGFRYVLIETDVLWSAQDFTAIAVYSDMEETLDFECSNDLINRFVSCTRWSAKNNHADVPTDCPTRERHGWTGDAQIFVNTASYFFDYAAFARKYTADMTDGQRKNGCFRQITPMGGIDRYMNVMDGSAGWSDAGILIPYRIYKRYGDADILKDNYASMRRYTEYKIKTLGRHYITGRPTGIKRKYRKYISNYGQSYGEWAEPADVNAMRISDFVSPHPEETTAYIVYILECMAQIAALLGEDDDAGRYGELAGKVKAGYQALSRTDKYGLDTDRQARLVRPLYLCLLDDEQTDYAKKRLIEALDRYGFRVGTGFLSTPFILYVLAEIDIEYAYRLLENEQMPGWLFMPGMGATTIWESWEGTQAQGGIASLDHYSKGAACEWIFDTMCGIKVDGEAHFTIAPRPGGSLSFARCAYRSAYGLVESRWEKIGHTVEFYITIPPNCTADISLPDGYTARTQSGEYTFRRTCSRA